MSHLRDLQEKLMAHILNEDQAILKNVVTTKQIRADERLAIYRDAYYLNLGNILRKDFGILENILGEDEFEQLTVDYITAYPSSYFNVNEFGRHLPKFLTKNQPYAEQPYLAELAAICWAWTSVLITTDATSISIEQLASIPQESWPALRLVAHPSVKLLQLNWNTAEYWQALQQNKKLPALMQLTKSNYCLIWRKGLQPFCLILSQEAGWVLQAFQAGKTFADVCEGLTEWMPEDEVAQYVVNLLMMWLKEGLFSEFNV